MPLLGCRGRASRAQVLQCANSGRSRLMIKEHDRVVLKKSVPAQGLKTGDVGTVIHVYKKGAAFEVEFLTLHGETVAIATLVASQVRPVQKREITHARLLRA
jgi:uncharacterized protein DUF4926